MTQQVVLEVGGMVYKPRPLVLIDPGKPLVSNGFGRNGRVAMFVVLNLSIAQSNRIGCCALSGGETIQFSVVSLKHVIRNSIG